MRKGRLWLTGIVGSALLAGLVTLVGLDLAHRFATPAAVEKPQVPAPVGIQHPVPAPDCCPPPDPISSVLPPPLPTTEISPALQFLLIGEVPMELQAVDRNLTIPLTPAQIKRLRESLATTTPADIPSPSVMLPSYPWLKVIAHLPGGDSTLFLSNPERLAESRSSGSPYISWSMPPGLWQEVSSWLPPETSKPGELAYLLRAEQLIEPNPSGPISYEAKRAALVARMLQAGTPIEKATGEPQFTHTYVVEGKEYPVAVGDDWFTYAGHSYHLKDAALHLGATLHAN